MALDRRALLLALAGLGAGGLRAASPPGAARQDDAGRPLPALTAPLAVHRPTSQHWILIGSLLEDLRRIHETLAEATED